MAEIRVQFRHVPGNLYRNKLGIDLDRATNELVRAIKGCLELFTVTLVQVNIVLVTSIVLVTLSHQVIRIQPNEAIYLKVNNKVPGLGLRLDVTKLDLSYKCDWNHL